MTLDIIDCLLLTAAAVAGVGLITSLPLYFMNIETFENSIEYILKEDQDDS